MLSSTKHMSDYHLLNLRAYLRTRTVQHCGSSNNRESMGVLNRSLQPALVYLSAECHNSYVELLKATGSQKSAFVRLY